MLLLLRKTRIIKKISLSFILMLTLLANNQSFAFTSFAKTQASESLTIAVEMLTQANSAQTESRQLIVKANKVRKQIKNLRVQMLKDKSSNDKLNQDQSTKKD